MDSKQSYLQFGCGLIAPESWRNFDASPTLRLQKRPLIGKAVANWAIPRLGQSSFPQHVEYGDVVKGLPIPPGSAHAVYCSHVLEHLALEELRVALRNIYGYLRPGGYFRFVLPDLEYLANQYLSSDDPQAALTFMERTHLGKKSRARGLSTFLRSWLGNSSHLWMWDYEAMVGELQQVGFVGIRRAFFGDATDPLFHEVERESRWENCLGIECQKGYERDAQ